ncbi:MAG: ROK family transcriptional regulator [Synergistaceae bacterium]|jgi:glucokinase-like ROK family protein|nr:ROK family transcriptional regulator [Synergistaceae bacterium]
MDKSSINVLNKRNVLNYIRRNGASGRAEIARNLGLSVPTVMNISQAFIDLGTIREVGLGESSGGKPPMLFDMIPDAYCSVGVDIGATKITAIVADCNATVIYKKIYASKRGLSKSVILEYVTDIINETINNSPADEKKIMGIGIGMPGLIDARSGEVLFSPDFGLENMHIIAAIERRFGKKTMIENVTQAIAVGEKYYGICKDTENFLCVGLGYGIGSAIVTNGRLYKGHRGFAGELGHIVMDRNGPRCDCGGYGCLEAISSGNAIAKCAKERAGRGERTSILELAGNVDDIEAKTVFDAAKAGDAVAVSIVENAIEYLGIAIAGMITMLDLEFIVMSGGITHAGKFLTDRLENYVERHKMRYSGQDAKIVISKFGSDAAAIGAASLILNRWVECGGNPKAL